MAGGPVASRESHPPSRGTPAQRLYRPSSVVVVSPAYNLGCDNDLALDTLRTAVISDAGLTYWAFTALSPIFARQRRQSRVR